MSSCESENQTSNSGNGDPERISSCDKSDPYTCDLPFYVCEFVDKEVGNDFKSLQKVAALVEAISAETKHLEEQVYWGILCFYICIVPFCQLCN